MLCPLAPENPLPPLAHDSPSWGAPGGAPSAQMRLLGGFPCNRRILKRRKVISGSGASGKQGKIIKARKMITLSKEPTKLPTVIVIMEEFLL